MSIVVVLSCVVFIMPPNIVLAANYTWPLKTSINISREFTGSNYKTQHTGCDFSCSLGNDVYAIADGTVVTATDYGCTGSHYGGTPACSKGSSCPAAKASSDGKGSYANRICIDHGNGVYSFYAHLSTGTFKVKSGDRVRQGQLIAKTGTSGKSTGPHLHFEIRVGGNSTNYAKNPRNYLTKVNPVPNTVTTTPSIWKNSDSYTVGNSATLTWNSVDNATGYWLSVWYKGEQIVTTQVSGSSEYTLNNLGEGEYTAYITAYNDSSSKQGSVTFRVNYVSGEQTIPNGRYQICSALDNSSVISISGASTDDEANVLLYANERHDNQYFDFEYLGNGYYKITAKHSGKVLDVYWEKMEVGANVQQYYWNNGDNQQWVVKDAGDGYFYIISKSNSLYMDVYGGVASNDVNIDTYTGHGGTSEKWKLIPAGEQSVADGKY
ncbi:RICIN domain-containing protein [Agathobacter rectalis]|uniref:RICIN domain-containing protein n=1 Tax=Agathobacter rectalis TaxID=39491 RepID=UPI003EDB23F6